MKKRDEIEIYKEQLKTLAYHDLNHEALKISSHLIKTNPNNWQSIIKNNTKYIAITELMKARKGS